MATPMITTADLYEGVQALTGTGSAYGVAKLLGATNQGACNWRDGKHVMEDVYGLRAAQALGWDSDHVLACLAVERAERAGSAETAAVWRHVALRLATAASVVFLGVYSVFLITGPVF